MYRVLYDQRHKSLLADCQLTNCAISGTIGIESSNILIITDTYVSISRLRLTFGTAIRQFVGPSFVVINETSLATSAS